MFRRLAVLLLVLGLLAGCGEEAPGEGQATLWVTRDRGAQVLLNTSVPAGISAMEALRRKADVETSYGGRYVQAVDGVEGSLGSQRDWFYYVNGYEADVGAADYELHDGDVVWFDYRSWAEEMRVPVVVGAFPEPFVHGYAGKRRDTVVRAPPDSLARRLADLVGGRVGGTASGANVLVLVDGGGIRGSLAGTAGDPVTFYVGREAARRLLKEPASVRFRYSVP
jgi:Domain of unknown function (DUF4430)